jgi:hypothetical protein
MRAKTDVCQPARVFGFTPQMSAGDLDSADGGSDHQNQKTYRRSPWRPGPLSVTSFVVFGRMRMASRADLISASCRLVSFCRFRLRLAGRLRRHRRIGWDRQKGAPSRALLSQGDVIVASKPEVLREQIVKDIALYKEVMEKGKIPQLRL